MPTYEYACSSCQREWEAEQSIKDPPITECPECGQKSAKRLISRTSFSLQGSGWAASGYNKGVDPSTP